MNNGDQSGADKPKPKPEKGDYAVARRVLYGDYRDEEKDEGVIVGKPTSKDGYYDILSPYDQAAPFQGHIDDIEVVPPERLTNHERRFQEKVKETINSQV